MATQYGVLKELLDRWCKQTGEKVSIFWLRAAPDDWTAQRWASYWNNHQVMHQDARLFLLKELQDEQ